MSIIFSILLRRLLVLCWSASWQTPKGVDDPAGWQRLIQTLPEKGAVGGGGGFLFTKVSRIKV